MSTTLNATTVSASIVGSQSVVAGAATGNFPINHTTASANAPLTNGSGSGQAQEPVTFAANVNTTGTTYNLNSLAGFGFDGGTRVFSAIKAIIIENTDSTNSLTVGNAASNGWTGITGSATATVAIEPGGHREIYSPVSGIAVSGTNCNILIAAAAGTANIKVTIIGTGT